jgi:hypothetical protein
MGEAFELYKVNALFSRKDSPVIRDKKRQKIKSFVEKYQFKKIAI